MSCQTISTGCFPNSCTTNTTFAIFAKVHFSMMMASPSAWNRSQPSPQRRRRRLYQRLLKHPTIGPRDLGTGADGNVVGNMTSAMAPARWSDTSGDPLAILEPRVARTTTVCEGCSRRAQLLCKMNPCPQHRCGSQSPRNALQLELGQYVRSENTVLIHEMLHHLGDIDLTDNHLNTKSADIISSKTCPVALVSNQLRSWSREKHHNAS